MLPITELKYLRAFQKPGWAEKEIQIPGILGSPVCTFKYLQSHFSSHGKILKLCQHPSYLLKVRFTMIKAQKLSRPTLSVTMTLTSVRPSFIKVSSSISCLVLNTKASKFTKHLPRK